MIDLGPELSAWLSSPAVRELLEEVVRAAVRRELRDLLEQELVGIAEAAKILGMSAAAVRKAVERGQIRCVRIGRRIRFRRSDLLWHATNAS